MHRPREKRFDPIGHLIPKPHQTHPPSGHMARESTMGMTSPKSLRHGIAAAILMMALPSAVAQTKVFTPPPLNPHPKEALHIKVNFDRPEDARRYTVVMRARYRNQQTECGYIEPDWNRRFIYPEGVFDISNESSDPVQARFSIYLDRYNAHECNWEFASPSIWVKDSLTGKLVTTFWGLRESLVPGSTYKAVCPFLDNEHVRRCFGGGEAVPETPLYRGIPASNRIPITIEVSADSAPLRPRMPSHFSNFARPSPSTDERTTPQANPAD
ncbi:hypothetical protein SAMN02800692_1632 [Luteibacter sp. UNC138MFCol5.1]|uniref:hypothetical protein n=1 Tax=Luteibacter sp. UNC138MFCol5.1 TaxID=1502774 RepID=UPI0008B7DD91|nr:hypothetical protein [Luteibacter sp. UNC138MFCol5.1]SEO65546.1 hypothetical protein SAMN02800692_1632 [Luteibacter sp. UNC138MFCol5.1]